MDNDLWFGTSGPKDAEIVLVGESWGEAEAAAKRPFVGSSGTELNRILAEAGVDRDKVLCTNVVAARPQGNEMWRFFDPKDSPRGERVGGLLPTPLIVGGVRTLYRQILSSPRKVIIATGNYALWALTECTGAEVIRESNGRPIARELQTYAPNGIMSWRGSMWYMLEDRFAKEPKYGKTKVLPILHPASIMRNWATRACTVHDLKARIPMALRDDWRQNPAPVFWAPPTFAQARGRLQMWLAQADRGTIVRLAEDIETARGFITCLGLSDSLHFAMSIPFIRKTDDGGFDSWWTETDEAILVSLLHKINSHPNILIEGQNFIYDTQYIQHWLAATPKLDFDTMLAQNVMFPGTPKALDYLSSLYCRYHWYWKEDHKEWDMKGRIEDLLVYNCWDVVRTWEIAQSQRSVLAQLSMESQFAFKMKINDLCLRMMNRGVRFDTARRASMSMELHDALQGLYGELLHIVPQELVDPDFEANFAKKQKSKAKNAKYVYWYTSDKQTKFILHELLGLPIVRNRKTGKPTSGKEGRQELRKKFPEWAGLFDRLSTAESVANTYGVINSGLDPDGRIRCSFGPGGTETHRLNSSKNAFGRGTNLQNLSKGEEDD